MSAKSMFKRFKGFLVGPGGIHCPCCVPPPKKRKFYYKKGKRHWHQWHARIERQQDDGQQ